MIMHGFPSRFNIKFKQIYSINIGKAQKQKEAIRINPVGLLYSI